MLGSTACPSSAISLLFDEERRQFGDDEVDWAVEALDELLDAADKAVATKADTPLSRDESLAPQREVYSRAMALAKLLFRDRRFGFRCRDRAGDFTLTGMLRQRGGNCLGLSTLYWALASELHLPVAPLLFEGHIAACLTGAETRHVASTPAAPPSPTLPPQGGKGEALSRESAVASSSSSAASELRHIELSRGGGFLPKKLADRMYGRKPGRVLTDDELIAVHLSNRGAFFHVPAGEIDKGLAAFDGALELFPEYVGARINRATLLLQLGMFDEAADELERIVDLDPGPRYRRIAADLLIQVVARSAPCFPAFAPTTPLVCKGG